jgi:uncharacterized protein (DUF1697 family)
MQRHIAFLRGINVGGHQVKMQVLRQLFESIGFKNVETVIASGNVVFDAPEGKSKKLEEEVELVLEEALGYQAATFIRTPAELAAVLNKQPFDLAHGGPETVVYTVFVRSKPPTALQKTLSALNTDNDELRVGKREIYWLRRARGKESEMFAIKLGKALGSEMTVRNLNTVRRIVEKYC